MDGRNPVPPEPFSDIRYADMTGEGPAVPVNHEAPIEIDDGTEGDRAFDPRMLVKSRNSTAAEEPVDLTLQQAIDWGLERNPDLVALRAGEPVAHAAYHVAGTYPFNPQIQTQVSPYSRDRNGNDLAVSQQHVIVQTFELAGQRHDRTCMAKADWDRVYWEIRQAELQNVAQTLRLFFSALHQRELHNLAESLAGLNQEMVGVLERRVKAGQANYADLVLARLEARSARRQSDLAEANYQTALLNLRSHLNLAATTSVEPAGRWGAWRWHDVGEVLGVRAGEFPPPRERTDENSTDSMAPDTSTLKLPLPDEAMLRQLIADRPDLVAASAAVAVSRANLDLADAARTPDLQIGPMYQRDESSTEFWGIQAQIDIPVINNGLPLVRQRVAELHQQEIAAEELQTKALTEARSAILRYERALRLVEKSRGEFDEPLTDVLRSVEDQFLAGQIDVLRVFAARTSLIQSRRSYFDLLDELARAAADVEQATGLPPARLVSGPFSEHSSKVEPTQYDDGHSS